MARRLFQCCALSALAGALFLSGCSANTEQENKVGKEMVRLLNEEAQLMEDMAKTPTPENLTAGQERLKPILAAMEENKKQFDALPAAARARMDRTFKTDFEQAQARLMKAVAPLKAMQKS